MSGKKGVRKLLVTVHDISYTKQEATIEVALEIDGKPGRVLIPDASVPIGGSLEITFSDTDGFPLDFLPNKNQNN